LSHECEENLEGYPAPVEKIFKRDQTCPRCGYHDAIITSREVPIGWVEDPSADYNATFMDFETEYTIHCGRCELVGECDEEGKMAVAE
jgi:ribosomal protein S27AE